ncbi:hypothetical protein [Pedobacter ureilyticus]|uniref:Lipoprotein n=1 Tax=Pedobacter ureilyticus TaxID=1393051 RepID=A0ABW9J6V8_9SPHI|nr:hypothetical protein [Pedobacter helvus]
MKNIIKYILIAITTLSFACNNTQKNSDEAVEVGSDDTAVMAKVDAPAVADTTTKISVGDQEEAHINYADSIDFEKYEVGPQKRVANAPIDWTSYPEAKDFKTRITEAYKDNEVNFGGYYVTSIFGCGASCIMGFMVDVRDGKIYDLPLGEENSCLFAEDRALYNWMSRLFIAGVCKENVDAKKVYYKAYLWHEDKKEFEKVDESAFLKK